MKIVQLSLLASLFVDSFVWGIKFKRGDNFLAPGETVLVTGQTSDLTCDYIRWRNEKLHSISWSVIHSGAKDEFFVWQADGKKRSSTVPHLTVHESNSQDKILRLEMDDNMESEDIKICCEVKVLKDEGYGSMKPMKKTKCSDVIKVTAGFTAPELLLTSTQTEAKAGDMLEFRCSPEKSSSSQLDLMVYIGGARMYANMRGDELVARVRVEDKYFQTKARSIGGFQDPATSQVMIVDCIGKTGSKIASKTSMTIQHKPAGGQDKQSLVQTKPLYQTKPGQARHGRNYFTEEHRHEQGVPCQSFLIMAEIDGGVVLRGQISGEVMQDIESPTPLAENKIEVKTDAVTVLNILGYHGYRVVGVVNNADSSNRMIWTLERKYFELHKDDL